MNVSKDGSGSLNYTAYTIILCNSMIHELEYRNTLTWKSMKYNEKVRKTGLKIAISMIAPTFVKVNMCLVCLKKIQKDFQYNMK